MQQVVAHMLGWPTHSVVCECRRMGGGFGGKESQSALFACVAALAAHALRRPVKLRADRDDDFMITGKRHDAVYEYEAGFDDSGRILGARVEIALRAGFSADLSGAVATRALCHFDNAYYLSDVDIVALCCKTNTQSNTAFRGFGGPQGALVTEVLLDSIARQLKRDPLDVRLANFYGIGERDVTPYGQRVEDNIIAPLTDELLASSRYRERRAALAELNAKKPRAETRHRVFARQIRHLVQRAVPESGRRARACLQGRLGARESRRHGNGPGAQHEGRAGRRA